MIQKPKPFKRSNSKYYYFYYYDKDGKRIAKSTHESVKWKAQEYIDDTLETLRSAEKITDSEARANVIEWWFQGEEKTWFKQKFVMEEYELIY